VDCGSGLRSTRRSPLRTVSAYEHRETALDGLVPFAGEDRIVLLPWDFMNDASSQTVAKNVVEFLRRLAREGTTFIRQAS